MRPADPSLNREPNVIPMIDILLVLLIAFIVDTVHGQKKLDVQLPVPAEDAGVSVPPIVLEVEPGPSYRLNRQFVPPPELAARIADVFEGRPSKVLFVKGSPLVRYQDVITAFDVARGAGVRVSGVVLPGQ
jgi:biopolymer transport protein ExbD